MSFLYLFLCKNWCGGFDHIIIALKKWPPQSMDGSINVTSIEYK